MVDESNIKPSVTINIEKNHKFKGEKILRWALDIPIMQFILPIQVCITIGIIGALVCGIFAAEVGVSNGLESLAKLIGFLVGIYSGGIIVDRYIEKLKYNNELAPK